VDYSPKAKGFNDRGSVLFAIHVPAQISPYNLKICLFTSPKFEYQNLCPSDILWDVSRPFLVLSVFSTIVHTAGTKKSYINQTLGKPYIILLHRKTLYKPNIGETLYNIVT
jgi:hypothetical protein